jgi:hypothetical protein
VEALAVFMDLAKKAGGRKEDYLTERSRELSVFVSEPIRKLCRLTVKEGVMYIWLETSTRPATKGVIEVA